MMHGVLLLALFFSSFLAIADDTVLKLYRPFGEVTEQVSPKASQRLSGQCMAQSQFAVREDAWRCIAEGKIFDPCFAKSGSQKSEVLCPQSPWTIDAVQIDLTMPLSNENHVSLDMSRGFPWAIELVNGARCQALEPGAFFDSMPVRYQCTNQNKLVGHLQRCKAEWSMLEKTSTGIIDVVLSRVWF